MVWKFNAICIIDAWLPTSTGNIEQIETIEYTDESPQSSFTNNTNTKSKRKGHFVPIHETGKRKRKYPASEDLISEIHETMNDFSYALKNDPTK